MDLASLPQSFTIALPEWVAEELAALPEQLPAVEERMALAHRLADRNWREGTGGPFAAVVAELATGRIVSVGVNAVLSSGVSSAHAEVTALGLAQARLGAWDLGGAGVAEHELVVNARPCVQCYGATLWSGVRSLVIGVDGPEVEALTTFDEGPMVDDWIEQFAARGISVTTDLLHDEGVAVLTAYRRAVDAGEVTVYNARTGV